MSLSVKDMMDFACGKLAESALYELGTDIDVLYQSYVRGKYEELSREELIRVLEQMKAVLNDYDETQSKLRRYDE